MHCLAIWRLTVLQNIDGSLRASKRHLQSKMTAIYYNLDIFSATFTFGQDSICICIFSVIKSLYDTPNNRQDLKSS